MTIKIVYQNKDTIIIKDVKQATYYIKRNEIAYIPLAYMDIQYILIDDSVVAFAIY